MTQLIWMNSGQWCGRLFQTLKQSFGLSGDLKIQGIIPATKRKSEGGERREMILTCFVKVMKGQIPLLGTWLKNLHCDVPDDSMRPLTGCWLQIKQLYDSHKIIFFPWERSPLISYTLQLERRPKKLLLEKPCGKNNAGNLANRLAVQRLSSV